MTALLAFTLCACTSANVEPLYSRLTMKRLCIRTNPVVVVSDVVLVMQDGFQRHGITAEVYDGTAAVVSICPRVTTLRSWDFKPYLSHAEIRITPHSQRVASATDHLNGKGDLDLGKWPGTKVKIDPVMDKLLTGFH